MAIADKIDFEILRECLCMVSLTQDKGLTCSDAAKMIVTHIIINRPDQFIDIEDLNLSGLEDTL